MDNRLIKTLFGMLLLVSSLYAFQANFWNGDNNPSAFYFNTDMSLATGAKMQVISGGVMGSADKNNLHNGDSVCTNSVIRVTPNVANSQWALSNFASRMTVSDCYGGSYCPPMYDAGFTGNHPMVWIGASQFDNLVSLFSPLGDDFSHFTSRYDELGGANSFYSEPVTYVRGGDFPNKEAFAGVFCKGSVQVSNRGQNVGGAQPLPNLNYVDVPVSTVGSNAIKTQMQDVSCFGAWVKSPLNIGDGNEQFFQINYFVNNRPTYSSTGVSTVNINVVNPASSGACILTHTDYQTLRFTQCMHTPGGLKCYDHIMIDMTVKNSGNQAIILTGVTSSNSGYTANPASTDLTICGIQGIPAYLCPSSNGFYDSDTNSPIIYPGYSEDVWVNLAILSGASGPTNVILTAETLGPVCGSPLSCNDTLPLGSNNGIFDCAIDPATLSLGYHEIGNFKVTCMKLDGTAVPCHNPFFSLTDGWYWTNGLSGIFYVADNTHASGISTSGPGSSGWVQFNIGSISCHSDVSIHPGPATNYTCNMTPSPKNMYRTQSQFFTLSAAHLGNPATPDNAAYFVQSPLLGATSNSSVQGTTFTAANADSSGKLWGFAIFNDPNPYLGGAGCSADITVTGPPPTPEHCTITPSSLSMEVNLAYAFNVQCTDIINNPVPCIGTNWNLVGLHGGLLNSNSSYTLAYTDSAPGLTGQLTYTSGNAVCASNLSVSPIPPPYVCDLKPDSATLVPGQSQPFTFNCTYNGNPQPPDSAQYTVAPPALGSTSGSSVSGTLFTAGNNPGSGDLTGLGFLAINLPPFAVGAVDVSPITITSSPPPTNCTIDPDVYSMGTQEAVDFHVTCTANGPVVPCVGSDWSWVNLNGDFMFKDNQHAIAFSTSADQSTGFLQYASGTAICRSNITINNTGPNHTPEFACTFNPDAANVLEGGSVYFALACTVNNVATVPDDATYTLNPTTLGSNSNESVHGTTFDADSVVVSGHQYGLGEITIAPYPTLGGVAIANLKVVNNTNETCVGPVCECTGPGCNKPHGHSDFCTIRGGALNANGGVDVFPGTNIPLNIMCGPNEDQNCPGDIFWNSGTGYYVASQSSSGAIVVITTNSLGQIVTVTVTQPGGPSTNICSIDLYITAPTCPQVS